ncbi:MAG: ABC transporter substrate-binding protein [Thermodesulfobacteriota bacterium]|nr:ABC transporter substrate-binding protein [Thermodesulfobacteriota bacterium]
MEKMIDIGNIGIQFFSLLFLSFCWGGIFLSGECLAKGVMVKFGLTFDQTGPLATEGRKMITAWKWYQEYLNEELGGLKDINGNVVKIELLIGDTGFKPDRTISLYRKFKSQGMMAIMQSGSVELAAMRSKCLRDKIPTPANVANLIYPLPSPFFAHWASYSACSAAIIDYVKTK